MERPHYRRRQFGWVILAALLPGILVAAVFVPGARPPLGVIVALGVLALAAVVFSSLTVEVDSDAIRIHFTGGLPRRTIPLSRLREHRPVRNPWYYGWGIHRYPGGWLWNVAGDGAVELLLDDGSRLRIGSDEPEALSRAIARAAPATSSTPAASGGGGGSRATGRLAILLVAGVTLVGGGLLLHLIVRQMDDPVVSVAGGVIAIDTPFYGDRWPLAEVREVTLLERLPRVEMRTNGFAASGVLRGWFQVENLGRGRLYVDVHQPPYLLLRLEDGFVVVGFSDGGKTAALHGLLLGEWQPPQTPEAR